MAQPTTNATSTLAGRIREARLASGISLAEMARLLSRDVRTVAGWQSPTNPRSAPSVEMLQEIARVLGQRPSYFLDEEKAVA